MAIMGTSPTRRRTPQDEVFKSRYERAIAEGYDPQAATDIAAKMTQLDMGQPAVSAPAPAVKPANANARIYKAALASGPRDPLEAGLVSDVAAGRTTPAAAAQANPAMKTLEQRYPNAKVTTGYATGQLVAQPITRRVKTDLAPDEEARVQAAYSRARARLDSPRGQEAPAEPIPQADIDRANANLMDARATAEIEPMTNPEAAQARVAQELAQEARRPVLIGAEQKTANAVIDALHLGGSRQRLRANMGNLRRVLATARTPQSREKIMASVIAGMDPLSVRPEGQQQILFLKNHVARGKFAGQPEEAYRQLEYILNAYHMPEPGTKEFTALRQQEQFEFQKEQFEYEKGQAAKKEQAAQQEKADKAYSDRHKSLEDWLFSAEDALVEAEAEPETKANKATRAAAIAKARAKVEKARERLDQFKNSAPAPAPSGRPGVGGAEAGSTESVEESYAKGVAMRGGPVQIQSDAEYDAVPSGDEYIAPDGTRRRKR